jgi:hypothetical protein
VVVGKTSIRGVELGEVEVGATGQDPEITDPCFRIRENNTASNGVNSSPLVLEVGLHGIGSEL